MCEMISVNSIPPANRPFFAENLQRHTNVHRKQTNRVPHSCCHFHSTAFSSEESTFVEFL